jgi:hypothetical protein
MHFASKTLMAIAAFSFLLGHCDANLQLLFQPLTVLEEWECQIMANLAMEVDENE